MEEPQDPVRELVVVGVVELLVEGREPNSHRRAADVEGEPAARRLLAVLVGERGRDPRRVTPAQRSADGGDQPADAAALLDRTVGCARERYRAAIRGNDDRSFASHVLRPTGSRTDRGSRPGSVSYGSARGRELAPRYPSPPRGRAPGTARPSARRLVRPYRPSSRSPRRRPASGCRRRSRG